MVVDSAALRMAVVGRKIFEDMWLQWSVEKGRRRKDCIPRDHIRPLRDLYQFGLLLPAMVVAVAAEFEQAYKLQDFEVSLLDQASDWRIDPLCAGSPELQASLTARG